MLWLCAKKLFRYTCFPAFSGRYNFISFGAVEVYGATCRRKALYFAHWGFRGVCDEVLFVRGIVSHFVYLDLSLSFLGPSSSFVGTYSETSNLVEVWPDDFWGPVLDLFCLMLVPGHSSFYQHLTYGSCISQKLPLFLGFGLICCSEWSASWWIAVGRTEKVENLVFKLNRFLLLFDDAGIISPRLECPRNMLQGFQPFALCKL